MKVNANMLVAANILWNEVNSDQWTLSTRLQINLSMRKSFISVFAQLSLASDMLTKKKKIKYGIYKNDTELSKYICYLRLKAQKHLLQNSLGGDKKSAVYNRWK